MSKIERLTDEERTALEEIDEGTQALRIINQLTAALHAEQGQVRTLEQRYSDESERTGLLVRERDSARAEVTRLTAALEASEKLANVPWTSGQAVDHISCLHALQELFAKLSGAESRTQALQIEVAHLTECEPHDKVKGLTKRLSRSKSRAEALQAEVARLTAALEAAERKAESWERGHDYAWAEKAKAESRAEALQARTAELEAELRNLRERI